MKKIGFFLIFALSSVLVSAQGFRLGDSILYQNRPSLPKTRSTLKVRVDLSSYVPASFPQFGGTCVAQSFAKARTILECKKYGITETSAKIQRSFSPYYIYYKLSPSDDYQCQGGLDIDIAASFCLNKGVAKLYEVEYPLYYPFTSTYLGSPYPNTYPYSMSSDDVSAYTNRFGSMYKATSIQEVKVALNAGLPVVGGFYLPRSFQYCTSDYFNWPGDNFTDGHAMVIVGYDDYKYGVGCIKVANSWGTTWGNYGFTWIPYTLASAMMVRGYACSLTSYVSFQGENEFTSNEIPLNYKDLIETTMSEANVSDTANSQLSISFGFGDSLVTTSFNPVEYRALMDNN